MENLTPVSVVVPTYNSVELLKLCIDSLLVQEYSSFEIIVVNDGSTDDTDDYCKSLGYVSYTRQNNLGRSAARNAGIKKAQYKHVAFIDSDCIAHPSWLKRLVSGFTDQGVMGVSGAVIHVSDEHTPKRGERMVQNKDAKWPMSGSICYRRDVLDKVGGFNEDYGRYEDKELALRVWEYGEIKKAPNAKVYHQKDDKPWPDYDLVDSSAQWVRLKKSHDLHRDKNNPPPFFFNTILFPRKYIGLLWRLLASPILLLLAINPSDRERVLFELRWLKFLVLERLAIWKMALQEKVFVL